MDERVCLKKMMNKSNLMKTYFHYVLVSLCVDSHCCGLVRLVGSYQFSINATC